VTIPSKLTSKKIEAGKHYQLTVDVNGLYVGDVTVAAWGIGASWNGEAE